jgi:trans-aconitate 2-methyltransferase
MVRYTFGDDEAAVARLEMVASAYEPTSRRFLDDNAPSTVDVALDLGCGPAFSTQLLHEACRPRELIGIDSSPELLEFAQARIPRARFRVHDVAAEPLPGAPADVIYARLVLAHLSDPLGTARRWTRGLTSQGVLLIEDLEEIDAPPGPLRAYDEVSAEIVRRGGGVMYAGAALVALGGRRTAVTVPAALAARIYLVNVTRWTGDPTSPVSEDRLRQLESGLRSVATDDGSQCVSWIVRQVALRA